MAQFSLPLAASYLKRQEADSLQYVNRENGDIVFFYERTLERAENLGEYSAYRTYSTDELKRISDASDVMEHPEKFIALPRLEKYGDELDEKKIMLEFASQQSSDNEKALKKSLTGLFGSEGKFCKACEKLDLSEAFADFEKEKFQQVIIKWAEQNGLEYTYEMPESVMSDTDESFELSEDFSDEEISEEAETENSDVSEDAE